MSNVNFGMVSKAFETMREKATTVEGVTSASFYGVSPVESKASNPDLDVVVTVEDGHDVNSLNNVLQEIANSSGIPVDAWVLSERDLQERMRRIAAMRRQPIPGESVDQWRGFAFISSVGIGVLSNIIEEANRNPVNEKPIPPTPESKRFFQPID